MIMHVEKLTFLLMSYNILIILSFAALLAKIVPLELPCVKKNVINNIATLTGKLSVLKNS